MIKMLRVEVYVPSIGKNYEFSVHEHVSIAIVAREIVSMISIQEQKQWMGEEEDLYLCNASDGTLLPKGKTLHQCNVRTGNQLILV